jgi:hypothetical protein
VTRARFACVMNNMNYYMFDPREPRSATRCTVRSNGSSKPPQRRPEREVHWESVQLGTRGSAPQRKLLRVLVPSGAYAQLERAGVAEPRRLAL